MNQTFKKKAAIMAVLILSTVAGRAADAIDQVVLSDTFDARSVGALTADGGWTTVNPDGLKTKRRMEIMADSGNLMGNGTSNQILLFQNIAASPGTYRTMLTADSLTVSTVLMVSFDFYEPSTTAGGISIYVGSDPNASAPVNAFSLTDGTVGPSGSYTLNAPHHLDAVFNESGSVLEYDDPAGGTSSLNTGLMDVWIDNVRVAAGVTQSRAASPSPELASVFLTSDGSNQDIYLDNVEFLQSDAIALPPPIITSFTADPAEVNPGDSVTLSWSTTYAESLMIDQGVGDVTGMNSTSVTVMTNTIFSLVAMNAEGSATSSVPVMLLPPPLTITNLMIDTGIVTMEWNRSSDHYIVMSGDDLLTFPAAGAVEVSETAASNSAAVFPYNAESGFFQVVFDMATVDTIVSPELWEEVKAQSWVNAPTNYVYDVDLDSITGMTLPGQDITLAEMDEFSNLDQLSLAGSSLTTLGNLSSLTGLTWLNLSSNQLSNVTGLNVLTDLEALDLQDNLISDLSGIESLTHLRWLDLENNQITDLALLITNAANGGLGEDDELWLRGNPLSATATNQIQTLETTYNVKVLY